MPAKTPSRPVIYGKVDRGDYTVEKVFFESYPGYYVSGNLYRPKGRTGKLAAVLSPYGHWPEGRFHDIGPTEIRKQIVAGASGLSEWAASAASALRATGGAWAALFSTTTWLATRTASSWPIAR